ncbi:hypothetical protein ACSMXM_01320 [Pacificimonas sp. ICDLI1SI03]
MKIDADFYAREQVGVLDGTKQPPTPADFLKTGGTLHRLQATIDYAAQASGSVIALGSLPSGSRVVSVKEETTVTRSTATMKIGTQADDDAYSAAAVLTTANAATERLTTAAKAAMEENAEQVFLIATTGSAALPSSGTGMIIIEFVTRN